MIVIGNSVVYSNKNRKAEENARWVTYHTRRMTVKMVVAVPRVCLILFRTASYGVHTWKELASLLVQNASLSSFHRQRHRKLERWQHKFSEYEFNIIRPMSVKYSDALWRLLKRGMETTPLPCEVVTPIFSWVLQPMRLYRAKQNWKSLKNQSCFIVTIRDFRRLVGATNREEAKTLILFEFILAECSGWDDRVAFE